MGQSWGTKSTEGTVTCDVCGLVYLLKSANFPMREKGTCNRKRGKELRSYSGSRHYSICLLEEQNAKRSQNEEQSS